MKEKNTIISTDAEKAFDKIQYQFMIKKTLDKLRIEGNYFNIIKVGYKKHTAIILDGERLKSSPLISRTKKG